jgi:hypothetical protein
MDLNNFNNTKENNTKENNTKENKLHEDEYEIITDFKSLNLIFQHQLQSLCLNLADMRNLNQKELLEDFNSCYKFTFNNLNEFHSKYFKLKKKKNLNPVNYCFARKSDLQQCTRLKRIGSDYCVSHQFRRPYGIITDELPVIKLCGKKSISVIKHNYQGKEYYLDHYDNLYIEDQNNNLRLYGVWDAYKQKIDISKYWQNKDNKK